MKSLQKVLSWVAESHEIQEVFIFVISWQLAYSHWSSGQKSCILVFNATRSLLKKFPQTRIIKSWSPQLTHPRSIQHSQWEPGSRKRTGGWQRPWGACQAGQAPQDSCESPDLSRFLPWFTLCTMMMTDSGLIGIKFHQSLKQSSQPCHKSN